MVVVVSRWSLFGGRLLQIDLQGRINIGSDRTLARAPVWMGLERGPPIYFLGPLFIYLNITKHNIRYKKHGDNIEKKILRAPNSLIRPC